MKNFLSRISLLAIISLSNCTQNVIIKPQVTPTLSPTPSIIPFISSSPLPTPTVTPTIIPLPTPPVITITSSPVSVPVNQSVTPLPLLPTISVKTNRILFDTGKNPMGTNQQNSINNLSKLNDFLTTKFTVLFDNFNLINLDNIDTILIISPSKEYSEDEINKLLNFVKTGKKVIITGEWGGYGPFTATSVNQFLQQANLKINEDDVKEYNSINYDLNDEQLFIKTFLNHTVTQQISRLSLYSSASIDVIDGKINPLDLTKTKLIAFTGDQSFKIQATVTNPGVAAVSNIGAGKVIAIGDSSFFTNNDSNNNGKANIDENDNKQFILNLLNW